ncbi:hypothetical protein N182_12920 [Sinorhizobium sp. GL2]|nr:hypothetical protein N182_12920 [Sinorhizobium sp. GL2]
MYATDDDMPWFDEVVLQKAGRTKVHSGFAVALYFAGEEPPVKLLA